MGVFEGVESESGVFRVQVGLEFCRIQSGLVGWVGEGSSSEWNSVESNLDWLSAPNGAIRNQKKT